MSDFKDLPKRTIRHIRGLARMGIGVHRLDEERPMSDDVKGLAQVINEELPKLTERARNLATSMKANVASVHGSLTQAEDTNDALTKAAMELQAALGRTSNFPPRGGSSGG